MKDKAKLLAHVCIVVTVLLAICCCGLGYNCLRKGRENLSLSALLEKMKRDVVLLEEEVSRKDERIRKLLDDVSQWMDESAQLRKQMASVKDQIEDERKRAKVVEQRMEQVSRKLADAEERLRQEQLDLIPREQLLAENKRLREDVDALERKAARDRARFYYNMGVLYSDAGKYDDALSAYEQSLALDAGNPDAHYNTAVLYEVVRHDAEMALLHYTKYASLQPESENSARLDTIRQKLLVELAGFSEGQNSGL
jgi:tetratricopeptide (TPR) repeat protein